MQQFLLLLGLCLFPSSSLYAQDQGRKSNAIIALDFETFIDLLQRHHPENSLDQLTESREIQAEKKAGVLIDPEISVVRDKVPFPAMNKMNAQAQMEESQAMWTLNITQTLPWPGTLKAARKVAEATTLKTKADIKLKDAMRLFEGKEFFIRLVAASRMKVILT